MISRYDASLRDLVLPCNYAIAFLLFAHGIMTVALVLTTTYA